MDRTLFIIGLVGLCHAAYSATQHRNYLRLTEKLVNNNNNDNNNINNNKNSSLPIDIVVQTIICLLLACISLARLVCKFRPIRISSDWEHKTWDNVGNRTSFCSFNHRGKYLFGVDHQHSTFENKIEEVDLDQLINDNDHDEEKKSSKKRSARFNDKKVKLRKQPVDDYEEAGEGEEGEEEEKEISGSDSGDDQ